MLYYSNKRVFLQFEVSLIFDPCMTGLNYRFLFECFPRYYIVMRSKRTIVLGVFKNRLNMLKDDFILLSDEIKIFLLRY